MKENTTKLTKKLLNKTLIFHRTREESIMKMYQIYQDDIFEFIFSRL